MDISESKIFIEQAIGKHLAAGGTLLRKSFGIKSCLCPISCILDDSDSECQVKEASKKLSWTEFQVWKFINGFDGEQDERIKDDPYYQLGKEIYTKYKDKIQTNE